MKNGPKRTILLTSAALVAAAGAFTPGTASSQDLETGCTGGSKKCDYLSDCVEWVTYTCVKHGPWYWTYQKSGSGD
jgi:hypothetical protein